MDRRRPLEAVLHGLAAPPGGIVRPRAHVACVTGAAVVTRDDAEILAGVDDVRIGPVRDDIAGFAAADAPPVGEGDASARVQARTLRGAPVLQRAGHAVGDTRVDRHVVELADRDRR